MGVVVAVVQRLADMHHPFRQDLAEVLFRVLDSLIDPGVAEAQLRCRVRRSEKCRSWAERSADLDCRWPIILVASGMFPFRSIQEASWAAA